MLYITDCTNFNGNTIASSNFGCRIQRFSQRLPRNTLTMNNRNQRISRWSTLIQAHCGRSKLVFFSAPSSRGISSCRCLSTIQTLNCQSPFAPFCPISAHSSSAPSYPDYYQKIRFPLSLSRICSLFLQNHLRSKEQLIQLLTVLYHNAIEYSGANTEIAAESQGHLSELERWNSKSSTTTSNLSQLQQTAIQVLIRRIRGHQNLRASDTLDEWKLLGVIDGVDDGRMIANATTDNERQQLQQCREFIQHIDDNDRKKRSQSSTASSAQKSSTSSRNRQLDEGKASIKRLNRMICALLKLPAFQWPPPPLPSVIEGESPTSWTPLHGYIPSLAQCFVRLP